jgi:hypothetical protein
MMLSLLLLVTTVGFGAAADPASKTGFSGWGGMSAPTLHLLVALATLCCNLFTNVREFQALERNSQLINEVVKRVREIRVARRLPV